MEARTDDERARRPCVLYVCNDLGYFAAHRAHMARRALEEGWRAVLLAGGEDTSQGLPSGIERRHVPVERYRLDPRSDLRLARETARMARARRADVVHLVTIKPVLFGAMGLATLAASERTRIRTVASFPGLGRLFAEGASANRWLVAQALRLAFSRLDLVATFENPADRDLLESHDVLPPERMQVMSGAGLPLDDYAAPPREARPFRVLYAGRFLRSKGVEDFLEAAKLSSERGDDAEYWLAGWSEEGSPDALSAEDVAHWAKASGARFLGRVSDMPSLLGEVDAVCLPTRYGEGLPRILIEAAAASRPVIVSDMPGCRVLVESGVSGIVLEDPSAETIATAVARLGNDKAFTRKLGANAARVVRERNFDERDVQDEFMRLYQRVGS